MDGRAVSSDQADRDVKQQTDAARDGHTRDAHAAVRDMTVTHQPPAAARESHAAGPLARPAASDQVVVGNIAQPPPGFQPPTDLLADLDRADAGVTVVHAAGGMTGVGKTQLAAAYARAKLAAGWRLVAWVDAEDSGTLLSGLAAVADAAGLSDDGSGRDPAAAGRLVRHRLEADGDRCLLVFDNASDPEALRPFLPAGGAARVLVTTTREPVVNLGTSVQVDVFGADEALEFLGERAGLDAAGAAAVDRKSVV